MSLQICFKEGCKCLHHELLASIKTKSNEKAKLFLEAMANFRELVDNSGLTLLHYAVKYKNKAIVQYLIDNGCNINARDYNGATPLVLAITENIDKMIDLLLKNNANIYESKNTLQLVLSKCVNLNFNNEFEIYQSVTKIFKKINADFLSEKRGMVLAHLNNDEFARFTAVIFGTSKLVKFILEHDFPHDMKESNNDCTALHCAVMYARMKNAKMLIEYGYNVNALDKLEKTPLYYYSSQSASTDKQFVVLKHLLKGCVDPNAAHNVRYGLKHLIVHGNKNIVKGVMQSGINFSQYFLHFGSLLEMLILNDDPDIIDVLDELNIGFYVNAICKDERMSNLRLGNRVLSLAVKKRCVKKVKFLLRNGADIKGILNESHLALIAVYDFEKNSFGPSDMNTEIIELLLQYGDDNLLNNRTDWNLLENNYDIRYRLSFRAILAHLAVLEVLDKSPLKDTQYFENGPWYFKDQYNFYVEEAKKTKDIAVLDKITLFDLLLEKDKKKFVHYARNDEFISKFNQLMNNKSSGIYYIYFLRREVQKGIDAIELERRAASALETLTGLYTVVVYHIISYLKNQDKKNLVNSIK